MNINLSIDIPKEYNDMSQEELAQLSVNIKKLVDELNYVFSQIDEENMTQKFQKRLERIQKIAETTQTAYNNYIAAQSNCRFHVTLKDKNQVFNVADYTSASIEGKAMLIIPDVASDIRFKQQGIYISAINGTKVTMAWSNKDYNSLPNIGFTVVLI